MVGVPFAASRVFDELASLALDPAPGTRGQRCPQNGLDNADAVMDGAEFFKELLGRNTRNSKLASGFAIGKRSQTNPMELKALISTRYREKARNKPNWDIQHRISRLQRFRAPFSRNMYG